MEQSSCLPNVFGSLTQIEWWSGDAEKEKTDPLQHSLAPVPTRGQEKDTLDGTLNPNTLMQLDRFCKQSFATPSRVSASQRIWGLDADGVLTDTEALRKKRPIICNTAWPQCQPEDRVKYPLDGSVIPKNLMQPDLF
ncbi:Natural cytotoxicity triggering receptor 3 ligand 1 [Manis javanica]|nr:Natural cytotoxicity triggering receptor 3 ligand 1 [Manis javanica]